MQEYNVQQAQKEYQDEVSTLHFSAEELTENQQAVIFAKKLIAQTVYNRNDITFCDDSELFVSQTPTGYDVVGYFTDSRGSRTPFNITVRKVNGLWVPSKRFYGEGTRSCSSVILLWIALSIGCTIMGIIMYFIISAAVRL